MKKIRYGNKDWLIDDDANIPTPLIDWILEARQGNGIVYWGSAAAR